MIEVILKNVELSTYSYKIHFPNVQRNENSAMKYIRIVLIIDELINIFMFFTSLFFFTKK